MSLVSTEFHLSQSVQPHPGRTVAILKAHPEVRTLQGRNPWTFAILVSLLSLQLGLAWFLSSKSLWVILVMAWLVGAFANHALYGIVHEATHNLIFKSNFLNKCSAVLADLTNVLPGAMGFRIFHLEHHAHLSDYFRDADVASDWEARLIGNRTWRKLFWISFFWVFQLTRTFRIDIQRFPDRWVFVNVAMAALFTGTVWYFLGAKALLYLLLSFSFAIGLHPLGGRWLQEHYTLENSHETGSYYGPLNALCLNLGYHNEHHDFSNIPWNNLPKLRRMAPEFYESLSSSTSWTKLLFQFITDSRWSLYSRTRRQ